MRRAAARTAYPYSCDASVSGVARAEPMSVSLPVAVGCRVCEARDRLLACACAYFRVYTGPVVGTDRLHFFFTHSNRTRSRCRRRTLWDHLIRHHAARGMRCTWAFDCDARPSSKAECNARAWTRCRVGANLRPMSRCPRRAACRVLRSPSTTSALARAGHAGVAAQRSRSRCRSCPGRATARRGRQPARNRAQRSAAARRR